MPTASILRQQIEQSLRSRIPAALTPRPAGLREYISCGIPALDRLMSGGFPVGALAELVGPPCSGRTTVALSFLANVTAKGNVCAWIDVADALDPEAAAANGVDLNRLLWIRCSSGSALSTGYVPTVSSGSASGSKQVCTSLTPTAQAPIPVAGGGSPHPRSEGRGMSEAISSLLTAQPGSAALQPRRRDRRIGTPGAPNRPLTPRSQHLREREEQVATDRLPARRGDNLQPVAGPKPVLQMSQQVQARPPSFKRSSKTEWSALDRALRSADLLLQAGGFQAMILDLGSTPPEQAWRIPLATWFRFRAACERSRVSFLLLTQHPCARSSAELVLRMQSGLYTLGGSAMTGVAFRSEMERQRQHRPEDMSLTKSNLIAMRKPPQKEAKQSSEAQWNASATWVRSR